MCSYKPPLLPHTGFASVVSDQLSASGNLLLILKPETRFRCLSSKLQRAASSIALNLAEGSGRRSAREQRRFFDIAMGSLRETQAILDLCPTQAEHARKMADCLAAHLYRLIQVVQSRVDRG